MQNNKTDAETGRRGDEESENPRVFPLPLSAKILIWFFLNLTVLAAVFILLFNAQFRFNLDWVFASSAGQRVEAVRALIVSELNSTPPDYWDRVIFRFSEAYGISFSLFETNGEHLIGPVSELPPEVRARMLAMPPPPVGRAQPSPSSSPAQAGNRPSGGGSTRAFLRTGHPARYWLLMRTRLDNPQAGGQMRVILVGEARSLAMGGLVLDPAPWLGLGVGTVVLSVLFWFPLLHGITRCIGQMTLTTRQIAEGRFDVRVASRRGDELGSLAESINQMAARLNGLVKGQKRFLGDIAHELCSPLARLQMVLGIMEQHEGEAQREHLKSASAKADQIAALVNELLVFSRASFGTSAVRLEPVAVREAVEEAVRREGAESVEIQVATDGPRVLADGELLVRALGNLLRNAMRHGGDSGPITVAAAEEDGTVTIRVADNGPGVAEEELLKLFDAFYRVDGSRTRETGGVGLGLTIVKTCIESCSGSVLASNRHPHGLEVTIRLPAAP